MIIYLSRYRSSFDYIKTLYLLQKPEKVEPWVSLFAATTDIPVIVVTWYVGEIIGFTDEVNAIIAHLKKDYDYEAIEE